MRREENARQAQRKHDVGIYFTVHIKYSANVTTDHQKRNLIVCTRHWSSERCQVMFVYLILKDGFTLAKLTCLITTNSPQQVLPVGSAQNIDSRRTAAPLLPPRGLASWMTKVIF